MVMKIAELLVVRRTKKNQYINQWILAWRYLKEIWSFFFGRDVTIDSAVITIDSGVWGIQLPRDEEVET